MATASLIPVSEYLSTVYEHDCDYVDGELQERNVGELSHGVLQALLAAAFNSNRRAWHVFAGTEIRLLVGPNRYRIPDVCVLRSSDPFLPVVQKAPLICIEVLSPEDRIQRMRERIDDYIQMGVEHIWVIDPIKRYVWIATADGSLTRALDAFTITNTPIHISLADIFAELDEIQTQR